MERWLVSFESWLDALESNNHLAIGEDVTLSCMVFEVGVYCKLEQCQQLNVECPILPHIWHSVLENRPLPRCEFYQLR